MRGNKDSAILVELAEPYNGKTKWLFGSKRAIFRLLPPAIVGISYNTLLCKHNLQEPYIQKHQKLDLLLMAFLHLIS